jgi:DNA invertase Pin-like site-specific DNA recombinase
MASLRITAGSAYSAFCGEPQKAEFERDLIRERTGAGRKAAKKRGVLFGRPPKLIPDQRQLARRLVSEGKSVREIASVFNVHAATIYRLAYSKTGMAN